MQELPCVEDLLFSEDYVMHVNALPHRGPRTTPSSHFTDEEKDSNKPRDHSQ